MKLIIVGRWDTILILCRWHAIFRDNVDSRRVRHPAGPVENWPPLDTQAWHNVGINRTVDVALQPGLSFTAEACRSFQENMAQWGPVLRDHFAGNRQYSQLMEAKLHEMHFTLDKWRKSFEQQAYEGAWKLHSSRAILQAIKSSMMLRGGAPRQQEVIARSLAMTLPPSFQESFLKKVSEMGDEFDVLELADDVSARVPSAALVQRYELSLDVAIILIERELKVRSPFGIKFNVADSSPYADKNWLWSLYKEIAKSQIVPTFFAILMLQKGIRDYAEELRLKYGDDDVPLAELCFVKEKWKPWLLQIRKQIILHIPIPCALAPGHAGVADKVATEIYKLHINTPPAVHLADEAATFGSDTTDFGVEVHVPTFKVHPDGIEAMLPPWLERRPFGLDVDTGGSDSDALAVDVDDGMDDGPAPAPPPRAPTRGDEFHPNSYGFPGVQHLCDNANLDSNESMPGFDEFFKDLKQVEAYSQPCTI